MILCHPIIILIQFDTGMKPLLAIVLQGYKIFQIPSFRNRQDVRLYHNRLLPPFTPKSLGDLGRHLKSHGRRKKEPHEMAPYPLNGR